MTAGPAPKRPARAKAGTKAQRDSEPPSMNPAEGLGRQPQAGSSFPARSAKLKAAMRSTGYLRASQSLFMMRIMGYRVPSWDLFMIMKRTGYPAGLLGPFYDEEHRVPCGPECSATASLPFPPRDEVQRVPVGPCVLPCHEVQWVPVGPPFLPCDEVQRVPVGAPVPPRDEVHRVSSHRIREGFNFLLCKVGPGVPPPRLLTILAR